MHVGWQPRTRDDVLRLGLPWLPGTRPSEWRGATLLKSGHVRPAGGDRRRLAVR
eukprot:COSAG02_NODE_2251_length_9362_cov_19.062075_6_plen_54_part_00